jgi:hypothetical protein
VFEATLLQGKRILVTGEAIQASVQKEKQARSF